MTDVRSRYHMGRDFLREVVALDPHDAKQVADLQQRIDAYLAKGGSTEQRMTSRLAEIAEMDAHLLPLLKDLRVTQRMSLRRICDILAGKRIVSRYGNDVWHPSTVAKILKRNGLR